MLQIFLYYTQAKGMERADIHLIYIRRDISDSKFICDAGNKLLFSLFSESGNKNLFRLYVLLLNKENSTLNQGIGLSRTRSGCYQDGTVSGGDCLSLCGIRISKIKHGITCSYFLFVASTVSAISEISHCRASHIFKSTAVLTFSPFVSLATVDELNCATSHKSCFVMSLSIKSFQSFL